MVSLIYLGEDELDRVSRLDCLDKLDILISKALTLYSSIEEGELRNYRSMHYAICVASCYGIPFLICLFTWQIVYYGFLIDCNSLPDK